MTGNVYWRFQVWGVEIEVSGSEAQDKFRGALSSVNPGTKQTSVSDITNWKTKKMRKKSKWPEEVKEMKKWTHVTKLQNKRRAERGSYENHLRMLNTVPVAIPKSIRPSEKWRRIKPIAP